MKKMHPKVFAVVAALALLVPAGAAAKRPEGKPEKAKHRTEKVEKKNGSGKLSTANVKGTVTANDGSTLTVLVEKASGHAKACKGQELSFDVSEARFHTADNDADMDMDALDVLVGHFVKVRAKVARTKGRKTECLVGGTEAVPARAVHNKTTPKPEDEEEVEEATDELVEQQDELDDETDLDEEQDDELLDEEQDGESEGGDTE